jgi:F0F1-type ATP synthase membrane subunit b/b'
MKRLLASLLLTAGLIAFVPAVFAQEHEGSGKSSESKEGEEGKLVFWKWANFVVLAGGVGFLAVKNGGPFFAARAKDIRKGIVEAGELRKEAEERATAVEHRLANLETEIAALREESAKEANSETQRLAEETAADIAKIQEQAEQEISAAGKAARMELKRYSAALAVRLAEDKIRARMTPAAEDALVEGFVRDIAPSSKVQTI